MSDGEKTALVKAKKAGLDAVINYYFQTKTPSEFIKTRPGAAGMTFKYVPIGYVVSALNIGFGFNWEWKIIDCQVGKDQVWVRGELTIKDFSTGNSVSRSGVGGAIIKKSRSSNDPISIANDIKSADSDALKVAAAKFGIGADVKFKEMDMLEDLPDVYDEEDTKDSVRDIVQKKYFAVAKERGFDGEEAKTKIKARFKVEHMAELTTAQVEEGIALMEKNYNIVADGEKPSPKTASIPSPIVEGDVVDQPKTDYDPEEIFDVTETEDNATPTPNEQLKCLREGCTNKRLGDYLFCSIEGKDNCRDLYKEKG